MAFTKIERIDREIEKTRSKITEFQNKLKELEAQRTDSNFLTGDMCYCQAKLGQFWQIIFPHNC